MPYASGRPALGMPTNCSKTGGGICALPQSTCDATAQAYTHKQAKHIHTALLSLQVSCSDGALSHMVDV